MITEIPGVLVGHWTDETARTGCTVALFPEGTVASGEVRGGAPASRDFALLDPTKMVERLDAVVLSGGSAFGLASGDGVMRFLEARGTGFETTAGPVPIVVGLSLFDLVEGDGSVRPGPTEGRAAAEAASQASPALGRVGAGSGATVAKWRGRDQAQPGGLGGAVARSGDVVVAALIAVNATGEIDDGSLVDTVMAGRFELPEIDPFEDEGDATVENTTIGIVATNAKLSKVECHLVAQSAHDGFGRALLPAHTAGDGDAVVVAATGVVETQAALVRILAAVVTERAIRSII